MSDAHVVGCVWRLDDDTVIGERADEVVPLASVGKVLVLAEVARRVDSGSLELDAMISLTSEDRSLGGTGLLAHLRQQEWTVADLALAVAAISDNAATNALIRTVSLPAVASLARAVGLERTTVHDYIRPSREPDVPAYFASGTPAELVRLLGALATDGLGSPGMCTLLRDWLRLNMDRSLVADGIPHDPYVTGPVQVMNKTGIDMGVRADAGIVFGDQLVVYAVVGLTPSGGERQAVEALRGWGSVVGRLAFTPVDVTSRGHRSSTL